MIKQQKEEEARELRRRVYANITSRQKQAVRNSEFMRDENEKRKEIRLLNKMDHEEKMERKNHYLRMYKEKLAESLIEKANRVPPNRTFIWLN